MICILTVEQALVAVNVSVSSGSSAYATLRALKNEFSGMADIVRDDCAEEYYFALKYAQEEKGEVQLQLA